MVSITDIGKVLKDARLKNKMILKEVSLLSGLSSGYISRIENGSSEPQKDTLIKLCKIYSLDIKDYVKECEPNCKINLDIKTLLLNNAIYYDENELQIKDKLKILHFIDLLISFDDINYKKLCDSTLKNLNELKEIYGGI